MNTEKETYLRAQRNCERGILAASAQWDDITEDVYPGTRIGCTIAGERVEGIVNPSAYGVSVKMTCPFQAERGYNQVRSFFNRRPRIPMLKSADGPANWICLKKAKDILLDMYSDIMWLRSRADHIRESYARYLHDWSVAKPKEQARAAGEKAIVKVLSAKSGELKRMFKKGLLSESEYIERKKLIHDQTVEHLQKAVVRDPFPDYFQEEYACCCCLLKLRDVLTLIAEGKFSG